MGWTGEHRGFVVEAYYENNRSVIATQTAFRTRFALGRNAFVPDRKTILLWISNLRATVVYIVISTGIDTSTTTITTTTTTHNHKHHALFQYPQLN